jgi:hypothetical protein
MRQPSRSSIILMIAAPVLGCLLLWYVVFPLIEKDGGLQDLLAWKSSKDIDYTDDGFMPGEGNESDGGFDNMQSIQEKMGPVSQGNSSGPTNETTGGEVSAAPHAPAETGSTVSNNDNTGPARMKNNTGGSTAGETGTNEGGDRSRKTDVERVGSVISATLHVKRSGEQVKEMIKGNGKDQSKTSGGGGGLLLLPPDDPDPLDVPLDGGLTVLVAAALGYGVRKTGLLNRKKAAGDHAA